MHQKPPTPEWDARTETPARAPERASYEGSGGGGAPTSFDRGDGAKSKYATSYSWDNPPPRPRDEEGEDEELRLVQAETMGDSESLDIGDQCEWKGEDKDIPRGTVGTVVVVHDDGDVEVTFPTVDPAPGAAITNVFAAPAAGARSIGEPILTTTSATSPSTAVGNPCNTRSSASGNMPPIRDHGPLKGSSRTLISTSARRAAARQ